jgi:hypothetical protein
MIEDAKIYGVWVKDEQVGFYLNKNEANTLATELEDLLCKDDKNIIPDNIVYEIDLYLDKR